MNSLQSHYINGGNPYNGNMIFLIQLHYYHHIELKSTYFEIPVFIIWEKCQKFFWTFSYSSKKNRFSAEIFNSYLYFSSIGTRLYIFFFGLEISNN